MLCIGVKMAAQKKTELSSPKLIQPFPGSALGRCGPRKRARAEMAFLRTSVPNSKLGMIGGLMRHFVIPCNKNEKIETEFFRLNYHICY